MEWFTPLLLTAGFVSLAGLAFANAWAKRKTSGLFGPMIRRFEQIGRLLLLAGGGLFVGGFAAGALGILPPLTFPLAWLGVALALLAAIPVIGVFIAFALRSTQRNIPMKAVITKTDLGHGLKNILTILFALGNLVITAIADLMRFVIQSYLSYPREGTRRNVVTDDDRYRGSGFYNYATGKWDNGMTVNGMYDDDP